MADRLLYKPIPEFSREEVEAAIKRDDPEELLYAVLSAALHDPDAVWAEQVCLHLAGHPDFNVRGNAILGFAHIARIHRSLNRERVGPVVESAFHDPHEYVRAHAHGAMDDLEHYLGWRFSRPNPLRDWHEGRRPQGVVFRIHDLVRVVTGPHAGNTATVELILSFDPDPMYIVELSSGADLRIRQSELEHVE